MIRAYGFFFFARLAATARDRADLVLYALAFAPPYLALLVRGARLARSADAVRTSLRIHG